MISFQRQGRVARLTLSRPAQGNPIDLPLAQELADLCREINLEPEFHLVVLSGAGGVFSRGEDYGKPGENGLTPGAWGQTPSARACGAMASLLAPAIAAIGGDAIGAGLELALACDLRLAADTARFALPQVGRGHLPSGGGTQRLPRLIGRGRALELLLTGRELDAAEALKIGLVNQIAPAPDLEAAVSALAERLLARGPIAVKYAKEAALKGLDLTLDQGLRLEADLSLLLQTTHDRAEGIAAFLQKRAPTFRGD
ncbi:MAG: enoyl-CoA hydratase/isomerase family protein [Chloroflexi bacterium]|nr:enoyl-CoA hydratase/isomerase family protein [Chloroflexota bacterium]